MRVDLKAGHGVSRMKCGSGPFAECSLTQAGKSTQRQIEEALDRYSFVALSLGLKWRGDSRL